MSVALYNLTNYVNETPSRANTTLYLLERCGFTRCVSRKLESRSCASRNDVASYGA